MKQYLDEQQTAKLIELGFEKPKSIIYASAYQEEEGADPDVEYEYAYSIGELLSFIPDKIESEEDDFVATFQMTAGWEIYYTTYSDIFYYFNNVELVDALFDMVVKLKEEGKI